MVRWFIMVLALCVLGVPQAAQARGIPIVRGEVQSLAHVADTTIPAPNGAKFALCHFYTTQTVYWLAFWSSSTGYVLSDAGCTGTAYYANPEMIAAGFANGQIPADVPRTARFTPVQIATGFTWPLAIGALILIVVLIAATSARRYKTRSGERMEVLGLQDGPTFRFIDAMLHAANADGQAQPEEIAYIKATATDVTGLAYTDEHIEWAITHTDQFKHKRDFRRFGNGLNKDQKRAVLRGALAVVASDFQMSQPERVFVNRLADGLGLGQGDVQEILQSAPAAPA